MELTFLSLLALLSIPLYVFYLSLYSFLESRRHAEQALQMGCKPPKMLPTRLPLGLDFLWRLMQADKQHLLPPFTYELYKEMGVNTWEQSFLGVNAMVTVDPKNVQAILATQFKEFVIGATRRGNFYPFLGNGIFTTDGKEWEHSRAMIRPQFAREQITEVAISMMEFHIKYFFMQLPIDSDGWTEDKNIHPMTSRLIMDISTEFLCGESVFAQILALPNTPKNEAFKNTFRQGSLDWVRMSECFDLATKTLGVRIRLFDRYYLYSPPSFFLQSHEVHKFMDHYVHKALDRIQNPPSDVQKELEKDATHKKRYVFLDELAKETQDPIELRSQLLNVLVAGRDTTAGTVGWLFTNLSRNRRVFLKLRGIILEHFGTAANSQPITFEAMKNCTYLQYVINESLRVYPNVSMNSRRATCDTTLPHGGGPDGESPVYVRKGQEVNYYVLAMHRRKDLWGPDSEEFVPERWEGKRRGWEYIPFNGGPRNCIGQQFALTEAGYVLVRILQKYDDIENMDPDPIVRHTYLINTNPTTVKVRFHEAPEDE